MYFYILLDILSAYGNLIRHNLDDDNQHEMINILLNDINDYGEGGVKLLDLLLLIFSDIVLLYQDRVCNNYHGVFGICLYCRILVGNSNTF